MPLTIFSSFTTILFLRITYSKFARLARRSCVYLRCLATALV